MFSATIVCVFLRLQYNAGSAQPKPVKLSEKCSKSPYNGCTKVRIVAFPLVR